MLDPSSGAKYYDVPSTSGGRRATWTRPISSLPTTTATTTPTTARSRASSSVRRSGRKLSYAARGVASSARWTKHVDESTGQAYWHDPTSGSSTWSQPLSSRSSRANSSVRSSRRSSSVINHRGGRSRTESILAAAASAAATHRRASRFSSFGDVASSAAPSAAPAAAVAVTAASPAMRPLLPTFRSVWSEEYNGTYYIDTASGATTWDLPPGATVVVPEDTKAAIKRRSRSSSSGASLFRGTLAGTVSDDAKVQVRTGAVYDVDDASAHATTPGVPDGWERFTDEASGRVYYHHAATGNSRWDDVPVVAALSDVKEVEAAAEAEDEEEVLDVDTMIPLLGLLPGPSVVSEAVRRPSPVGVDPSSSSVGLATPAEEATTESESEIESESESDEVGDRFSARLPDNFSGKLPFTNSRGRSSGFDFSVTLDATTDKAKAGAAGGADSSQRCFTDAYAQFGADESTTEASLRAAATRTKLLSVLRSIPLLHHLDDAQLRALIPMFVRKQYRAGERIMCENDPAPTADGDSAFFLILSGEVAVHRRVQQRASLAASPISSPRDLWRTVRVAATHGATHGAHGIAEASAEAKGIGPLVAVLRTFDFFGERALLMKLPRNATCIARATTSTGPQRTSLAAAAAAASGRRRSVAVGAFPREGVLGSPSAGHLSPAVPDPDAPFVVECIALDHVAFSTTISSVASLLGDEMAKQGRRRTSDETHQTLSLVSFLQHCERAVQSAAKQREKIERLGIMPDAVMARTDAAISLLGCFTPHRDPIVFAQALLDGAVVKLRLTRACILLRSSDELVVFAASGGSDAALRGDDAEQQPQSIFESGIHVAKCGVTAAVIDRGVSFLVPCAVNEPLYVGATDDPLGGVDSFSGAHSLLVVPLIVKEGERKEARVLGTLHLVSDGVECPPLTEGDIAVVENLTSQLTAAISASPVLMQEHIAAAAAAAASASPRTRSRTKSVDHWQVETPLSFIVDSLRAGAPKERSSGRQNESDKNTSCFLADFVDPGAIVRVVATLVHGSTLLEDRTNTASKASTRWIMPFETSLGGEELDEGGAYANATLLSDQFSSSPRRESTRRRPAAISASSLSFRGMRRGSRPPGNSPKARGRRSPSGKLKRGSFLGKSATPRSKARANTHHSFEDERPARDASCHVQVERVVGLRSSDVEWAIRGCGAATGFSIAPEDAAVATDGTTAFFVRLSVRSCDSRSAGGGRGGISSAGGASAKMITVSMDETDHVLPTEKQRSIPKPMAFERHDVKGVTPSDGGSSSVKSGGGGDDGTSSSAEGNGKGGPAASTMPEVDLPPFLDVFQMDVGADAANAVLVAQLYCVSSAGGAAVLVGEATIALDRIKALRTLRLQLHYVVAPDAAAEAAAPSSRSDGKPTRVRGRKRAAVRKLLSNLVGRKGDQNQKEAADAGGVAAASAIGGSGAGIDAASSPSATSTAAGGGKFQHSQGLRAAGTQAHVIGTIVVRIQVDGGARRARGTGGTTQTRVHRLLERSKDGGPLWLGHKLGRLARAMAEQFFKLRVELGVVAASDFQANLIPVAGSDIVAWLVRELGSNKAALAAAQLLRHGFIEKIFESIPEPQQLMEVKTGAKMSVKTNTHHSQSSSDVKQRGLHHHTKSKRQLHRSVSANDDTRSAVFVRTASYRFRSLSWREELNMHVLVTDLPRAARVVLHVMVAADLSEAESDFTEVAWAWLPLFGFDSCLREGKVAVPLIAGECPSHMPLVQPPSGGDQLVLKFSAGEPVVFTTPPLQRRALTASATRSGGHHTARRKGGAQHTRALTMRSAEMERLQRLLASERSRRMQAEQDVAMLQVRRLESTSSLHRLTPNHSPRSSMRSPSPGQRADKSLRIARGVLKHAHTVSSVSLSRVQRMALWQCRGHPELRGSPAALLGVLLAVSWEDAALRDEAYELMQEWTPLDIGSALQLLLPVFADPHVRSFAVDSLDTLLADDSELVLYMLQLTQVGVCVRAHACVCARVLHTS